MSTLLSRRSVLVMAFVGCAAITGLSIRADDPCNNDTVPGRNDCTADPPPAPSFSTSSCQRTELAACGNGYEWQTYRPFIRCDPRPPTDNPNPPPTRCGPAKVWFCVIVGGIPTSTSVDAYGACGKRTYCILKTVTYFDPDSGDPVSLTSCTEGPSTEPPVRVNGNVCIVPVCVGGVF